MCIGIYRNGHDEIAALLINQGADTNTAIFNATTPLHVASTAGNTKLVELLLNHGAKIDAEKSDGFTALHCRYEQLNDVDMFSFVSISALKNHLETTALLLKRGANIHSGTYMFDMILLFLWWYIVVSRFGRSPLHEAGIPSIYKIQ